MLRIVKRSDNVRQRWLTPSECIFSLMWTWIPSIVTKCFTYSISLVNGGIHTCMDTAHMVLRIRCLCIRSCLSYRTVG